MKKMIVMMIALTMAVPTYAIDFSSLTSPGGLLYGLDRAMERIELAFTFSEEAKTKKLVEISEERIEESEELLEKGDVEKAEKLSTEAEDYLQEAESRSASQEENVDIINEVRRRNKIIINTIIYENNENAPSIKGNNTTREIIRIDIGNIGRGDQNDIESINEDRDDLIESNITPPVPKPSEITGRVGKSKPPGRT